MYVCSSGFETCYVMRNKFKSFCKIVFYNNNGGEKGNLFRSTTCSPKTQDWFVGRGVSQKRRVNIHELFIIKITLYLILIQYYYILVVKNLKKLSFIKIFFFRVNIKQKIYLDVWRHVCTFIQVLGWRGKQRDVPLDLLRSVTPSSFVWVDCYLNSCEDIVYRL